MDYQLDPYQTQESQQSEPVPYEPKRSSDSMATASLVMGILALVTCCCIYGSFIFGGLGILFAILSRTEDRMTGRAKSGMTLSIVALVLVLVVGGIFIFWAVNTNVTGGPIQNLPVVPELTEPNLDNLLMIYHRLPTGGIFR